MAIKGISNNILHRSLVPKLRQALASANRNGMRRDKIEGIMQHVLGFLPDDDQFRHIMWVVHYQSGTNDLYYAVGNVPDEFKKEKKVKSGSKKQGQKEEPSDEVGDRFDEINGPINDVRVRGSLTTLATSSAKKKIIKVRIYYGAALLFLISGGLFAHLLHLV